MSVSCRVGTVEQRQGSSTPRRPATINKLAATVNGGAIFVCGDASGMSAGVRRSLQAIVSGKLGVSADEAGRFLEDLARNGRYALDVWASD